MSKENNEKSALVPRLRFPEFEGVVPALPLASVADLVSEKISIDQITSAQYVSTENLLPDFGGINPAVKLPSVSSVTSFRPNDVLVSNIRPYLKKVWQANICGGASNDVLVVRPTGRVGADYLAAILRSDLFIDYVMRGVKGVKMPRGEISMIQEFPVPCPSTGEQQKIADCLSSLDELITAETHKLDALKTHKMGLMQQLFPREGESVPRVRFPEFRESGDWEEKTLDAVCEMRAGKFVAASEISETQADGLFPCFGGNGLRGYTKTYNQSGRYSLIGRQGALCGNVNLVDGDFFATEHAVVTTPKAGVSTDWLFYNLCLLNLNRFATGQAQPGLSVDVLGKVACVVPSDKDEQQRIAACLSSIDELITGTTNKIAALKTHKKGLMQQLFPVLDEVPA